MAIDWPQLSSRHDTHFFYFAFASHSACAVAGVSAQMSADDDVANRLTGGKGNQGRRFWSCSCDLYADIHRRRSDPRERVIARNLWARALKRRARWEWADGERLTALRSGLRALVVSPAAVVASSLPGHPKVPWVQRARRSLGA